MTNHTGHRGLLVPALLLLVGAPVVFGADSVTLVRGALVERALSPGSDQAFELSLGRGEYVRIVVEQVGIDLVLALTHSGNAVAFRDRPNGRFGNEALSFVAPARGDYRLTLRSSNPDAAPGRYRLRVEERHPASGEDRKRALAEDLLSRANLADLQPTAASREEALRCARRSLELWADIGDSEEEALALLQLAAVQRHRGEHGPAASTCVRAIERARAGGHRALEARALDRQGLVLSLAGRVGEAADALRQSLTIARDAGDPDVEGIAGGDLAFALWRLSEYQEALDCLDGAVPILRRLGNRQDEAWSLNTYGLVHLGLGDRETAFREFEQAHGSLRSQGSSLGEAATSLNLGFLYLEAGLFPEAQRRFARALAIGQSTDDPWIEAWALTHLGHLHVLQGDPGAGLASYEAALALLRKVHDRDAEAVVLYWMGEARARQGALPEALLLLRRANALGRDVGDRYVEADTLSAIARTELAANRLDAAREHVASALGIVESGRARLQTSDLRSYFLASNRRDYDLEVETLLRLHRRSPSAGHDRRAFESSERARARSLRDTLGTEALSSLTEVQRQLPPHTVLVSYQDLGESALAFVVADTDFGVHQLTASTTELGERTANYRELLARGDDGAGDATGQRLYADLIAPWRPSLPPGTTHLVFAPDGPLHHLPFEALRSKAAARRLIEDFAVSYVPSAGALIRMREPSRPGPARLFLIAEPHPAPPRPGGGASPATLRGGDDFDLGPLPFTAAEARTLAAYAGSNGEIDLGTAATEARVKAASLEKFQVLHFASHGLVAATTARSALVLAPGQGEDGLLEAREIERLRLASDLVVLAACHTASGRVLAGEGVQGLARAFLRAGARSVVASLWSVQDDRTAALMSSFYRRLTEGSTTGEALRAARIDLMRAGAPGRDWAPFILIGDGQRTVSLAGAHPGSFTESALLLLGAALALAGLATGMWRSRRRRSASANGL